MPPPNPSYQYSKFRIYLGSALFLTGALIVTFFISPVVWVCTILPFAIRYQIARRWALSVIKLAEVFCGIRYEIDGLNHINPKNPAVVLSNHQSAWETIAFRCFLPPQTSLFKQSLLNIPFWGWAMATLKPIAIDRNNKQSALRKLIGRGTEALQEGLWVVVFPEGTRMPIDKIGAFSAGGAMLAQKSGFPVVPIAHNAGKYWSRNSFLKYPGIIKVKIGPPIVSAGRKAAEINQEVEQWVIAALQELD